MIETSAFAVSFFGAHSLSIEQLNDFNKPVFALLYINRFSQEFRFPVRYKITEDDKIPISDRPNKFDVDNMNNSMK